MTLRMSRIPLHSTSGYASQNPAILLNDILQACAAMGLQIAVFVPASIAMTYARQTEQLRQKPMLLDIAYGATRVPRREPLAIRARIHMATPTTHHRRPLVIAAVVASTSVLLATLTPAVLAFRASRLARRTIATLAPARAAALTVDRDVAMMAAEIRAVRAFEQQRHSKTLLLAQLTQALPSGTVITTLTADTSGVTVVALAPKAADVVRGIEEMLGASHVALVGPVTREVAMAGVPATVGGIPGSTTGAATPSEVERVTIRFQLAADGSSIRYPLDGDDTE